MNRPEVLALFARQHWVASCQQVTELGVSSSAIGRARSAGTVVSPYRGVLAVAGVELAFAGRALALQLAGGPTAFVSGPSAGVLHGLREMPKRRLEITVKERRATAIPRPHRRVWTSWLDESRDVICRPDGLRVASPLRMLFGLAEQFNQHRFQRAAEDAWQLGLVTPDTAGEYLAAIRRSGRTGVIRLEAWLEQMSFLERPAQTGLEQDFIDMIARVGLPTPIRQHPLRLANGELIHLDLAWPAARLAIEPGHSRWHVEAHKDHARDRACSVVGWQVERYDQSAPRDKRGTALEILAIYRRRIADLGGSLSTSSR
jgi:hypothetical protein